MYHHELVTPNEGLTIRVIEHSGDESRILLHQHQSVEINLDYSPRYLGHEIASGRSEINVWSVANTD